MSEPTMQGWGMQTNTGTIEDLELMTVPVPKPAAGQMRVKVVAVSTNPIDVMRVRLPAVFPGVFGVDGAGIVDALGEGVTSPAVGTRVHFSTGVTQPHGSFAPYCIVRAAAAVRIPDGMSMEDAAVTPVAGWTAYEALVDRLHVSPGMTVIINGASGGVGHLAVQLAVALGARVIAVCSGDEWCGKMRAMGSALVIDYRTQDIVKEVRAFTNNEGADCAFDVVNADTAITLMKALRVGGSIAHIACVIKFPDSALMSCLTAHHVLLGVYNNIGTAAALKKLTDIGSRFDEFVASGKVKPIITARLSFGDVKKQMLTQAGGRMKGKAVIIVSESK